MKKITLLAVLSSLFIGQVSSQTARKKITMNKTEQTAQAEHYTFQLSDKVTRQAVTFNNRYGITVSGDLYTPKNIANKKLAAIILSGPFGAVKEQSSGL